MSPKIYIVSVAVLIIAGLFTSVLAEEKQCGIKVSELKKKCMKYVKKAGPPEKPSEDCCKVLKKVDVQCVCMLATEDAIKTMSKKNIRIEKAIFMANSCGIRFSPGEKCGSYTVPSE